MLSGCSWFGDDEEEDPRDPVPLTGFDEQVKLHKLWRQSIGDAADESETRLVPVIQGSRIFGASVDGSVAALDIFSGRRIWRTRLTDFYDDASFDEEVDLIVGGLATGRDIVVVSLSTGELLALNISDGTLAWRSKTSSEVVAPAVMTPDRVIVQSIDGKVASYDVLDGTRQWIYSASLPSLTLRGTSTPLVFDRFVLAGFANGRIALIGLDDGVVRFEQRVAAPKGDSDLDKLVDIDGAMALSGSVLYVVSYQGNVIALNLASGKPEWGKEASSAVGLTTGFGAVYVAQENGVLDAMDMDDGNPVWSIDSLKYRELSTPVILGSYVVVGDLDGYLHLVAQSDGRFVGRSKVDSEAIKAPVVVEGNRLYLMGNSGKLSAFEVR